MDGALDIFLANLNGDGNQLFSNQSNKNNWIKFKAVGTESNRDAIGARVIITVDGKEYVDEIHAGSGYASQSSQIVHFGLGTASMVDDLKIIWPGGDTETHASLEANQYYEVTENGGVEILNIVTSVENNLLETVRFKAYPNPLQDQTSFEFSLSERSFVKLEIYDLNGRIVNRILDERISAGNHVLQWNAESLRKGIYVVSFEVDGKRIHEKLIRE